MKMQNQMNPNDDRIKIAYKKPQLKKVRLFADQVLGQCRDALGPGSTDICGNPAQS
jgi:hypothetical protein